MLEIKCRACGATQDESEDIYSYFGGNDASGGDITYYQHRHAYQCVDYLKKELERSQAYLDWYQHECSDQTTVEEFFKARLEIDKKLNQ